LGGGGNDAVKNTNTNEIQILFAGYQKPAKLGKIKKKESSRMFFGILVTVTIIIQYYYIKILLIPTTPD
jgi:hypothetical protein